MYQSRTATICVKCECPWILCTSTIVHMYYVTVTWAHMYCHETHCVAATCMYLHHHPVIKQKSYGKSAIGATCYDVTSWLVDVQNWLRSRRHGPGVSSAASGAEFASNIRWTRHEPVACCTKAQCHINDPWGRYIIWLCAIEWSAHFTDVNSDIGHSSTERCKYSA